jgi:hypothetical protein
MGGTHLLALLAPVSLLAAVPVAASTASEEPAVEAKDKLICKRTQRTGTRFYSQICKTAAQWDALAEQQKRDLREQIDRPQVEIRRN